MNESLVELTIPRPSQLDAAIAEAQQASDFAELFLVHDQYTAEVASASLQSIKEQWASIEAQREFQKAPIREAGRRIEAFFQPALDYLERAEKIHKRKIAAYLQQEENARQAAQAKAREAARAEQERLAKEAVERENKAKALEIRLLAEAKALQQAGNDAAAHDLVAQADSAALAGAQEAAEKRAEAQRAGSMQLEIQEKPKIAGITARYSYEPEYVDLRLTVEAAAAGHVNGIDLLTELTALTNSAKSYMDYHAEKFYQDSATRPTGLSPAIARARFAIAEAEALTKQATPVSVLTWDTKVCGKMVDGLKEETRIPGVTVKRVPIIASHKRS